MSRPQYILLPVNSVFIAFSLGVAFLLNLIPWGRTIGVPDCRRRDFAILEYSPAAQSRHEIAFLLGMLMDVHDASLFGEHALAYTLLSYGAIMIHRRVLWFFAAHADTACCRCWSARNWCRS